MLLPPPLQNARPDIVNYFQSSPGRIYSHSQIRSILKENRHAWQLPGHVTTEVFIAYLLGKTQLRKLQLKRQPYTPVMRYTWGDVSPYELALSLRRNAYLSHGSAAFLHLLISEVPNTVYLNQEQSVKPDVDRTLDQEAIDLAFSRPQRQSSHILKHEAWRIVLISGKNTGRLEVGSLRGPSGESLEATKLERTLIDITVRPGYAGGVHRILEAFKSAKDKVRIQTLITTLKNLNYTYPYHQAIGFYMERVGYHQRSYKTLRNFGLDFDFYLAHGLDKPNYDRGWRLYYPRDL